MDRFGAIDKLQPGERQDTVPIERGLEGEVEAGQGLDAGQASHFERRIAMLARVWQKTLVASVRTSSVTSDNAPLRL